MYKVKRHILKCMHGMHTKRYTRYGLGQSHTFIYRYFIHSFKGSQKAFKYQVLSSKFELLSAEHYQKNTLMHILHQLTTSSI